jgi:hypothetical protein
VQVQFIDQLQQVGFGDWSEPRCGGSVVRRDQQHSGSGSEAASFGTFRPFLMDELPAIRSVPVECNEEIHGLAWSRGWRFEQHVSLFRTICAGDEGFVTRNSRIVGIAGQYRMGQRNDGEETAELKESGKKDTSNVGYEFFHGSIV